MDKEFQELLAKLAARDDELKALVEKANGEAKAAGVVAAETKAAIEKIVEGNAAIHARLLDMEQKQARRAGGDFDLLRTTGASFTDSDMFKKLQSEGRGTARMTFKSITMNAAVTNVTSSPTGTGGVGNAIAPDRLAGIISPPDRRMTVRDLILPGRTGSNLIQYVQETGFQNMAAPVAEGGSKPQSDLSLDLVDTPVRTIAHWIKASVQVLADIPLLQSYIDGRLRYGLQYVEEQQLLAGDGTGQNLEGLIPQATPFNTALLKADDQQVDVLRRAILQVRIAEYAASGIVLNPNDWADIETLKDNNGRYIFGNPGQNLQPRMWGLPVVDTNAMPAGQFMVGAFNLAAQVFDREDANVQVSTEDGDNFTKNMVTIRAEERLALAVFRPQSFVYGAF
ncbi:MULTISPECIES: phage major capsid protein [unclassified Mesorhizobium]|uniref:phage major capsid protein n=1 Tax=unclassified Mesorhizobium TaxID=325217 RepID=UPI00112D5634|nr:MULTISPECIES: phage major capsid protein [unclassified Mesorhizobium]MCA0025480.1 phage major capsid protein [Mesorhizobium sp. B263B1A]TPJ97132.1 phage major capsid protein [Mesorhizobium sp. B2-5-12]TPK27201.1 phage major capsid protein [Mesorhizobium sp. B2-5-6]